MRRRTGCQMLLAAALGLTAQTAHSASITVDAGGACSLADAITAANSDTASGGCPAGAGADIITLEKDVVLSAALPAITSTVTIEGSGHKIDGNGGSFSVLRITTASGNLTLNRAAVTGGASMTGGGMYADSFATVTLNNSTVSGNEAGSGGGISVRTSATATLNSSTVSGNSAISGGGIDARSSAIVTLNNSTVSGNSADFGGGLYAASSAAVSLNSSTVSGNSASEGGGIYMLSAAFTLRGSLISGNMATASSGKEVDSTGTITADSSNVFGHSGETNAEAFSGFTPGTSDVTAASDGGKPTALAAILSPLTNNGGPTKTHALPAGSPAVDLDAGCSVSLSKDQRGYSRPVGSGCDAGAVERLASIAVDAGGVCSLADAITAANTDTAAGGCPSGSGADIITLEKDVVLAAILPAITSTVTIEANGHKIDGNGGSFFVLVINTASGNLTLNRATVTGGNGNRGGGIDASSSTVTLNNCTVSGNTGMVGGGIYASSSTVTLNNCTVSGNTAIFGNAGGIFVNSSTVTLNSSTVSGNSATSIMAAGGGICVGDTSTVILKGSLVSGNSATAGGNEIINVGTITAASSNLFGHSGETSAQAFNGFTPGGGDVVATSDGGAPAALSNIISPLADNGGPTKTHALPAGSPAVDLGAAACPNNLVADQRGYNRPINFKCDAGAVEYSSSFSTESGTGRDLPASTWLMTAPSCTPGPDDIAIQYGDDIPGGVYGTNWISYKWDAAAQSYGSPQAGTDVLLQGTGNWLYSLNAATLALTGTATPTEPCSNYGSGLSGNCFAIDLTPSSTALWQIVGHPFPYSVSWADVRVATYNGSAWTQRTPTQAKDANIMAKEMWRWSGSAYETKDDATVGLTGTLLPQEAVWVRMLTGSSAFSSGNIKLLVPAR